MTLLTTVQNACLALGLASPATVVGNTNELVKQMLALSNQEGKDLASRAQWKALRRTRTFNLVTSDENQGAMNSTVVAAGDFDYILNGTFNNITLSQEIAGPLSDQEEEQVITTGFAGPYQRYTIRGGDLYIYPQPTATDSCQFQYISTFWCKASGGTKQAAWAADTDLGILDERLMELGLIWRWKRAKGLDYAQEFDTYEKRVHEAISREGGNKPLYMDGPRGPSYGIVIPIGSWSV